MAGADAPAQMETNRLEAFSDGVFAVAITLLALNLVVPGPVAMIEHPPQHGAPRLTAALLEQWPSYLAYALSFLSILIMWINHHALFQLIRRTDHVFLLLNGLLLLIITAIPFATNLLATYLQQPDKTVAQVVYSGLSLLMALTYNRMWAYASRGGRLLADTVDQRLVRSKTRQYAPGPLLYGTAFVAAFFSAYASLALCMLLAVFFALPSTVIRTRSR